MTAVSKLCDTCTKHTRQIVPRRTLSWDCSSSHSLRTICICSPRRKNTSMFLYVFVSCMSESNTTVRIRVRTSATHHRATKRNDYHAQCTAKRNSENILSILGTLVDQKSIHLPVAYQEVLETIPLMVVWSCFHDVKHPRLPFNNGHLITFLPKSHGRRYKLFPFRISCSKTKFCIGMAKVCVMRTFGVL